MCRIKHRVKENWLKMYDKSGLVLRVEMVINNPEEFKVRKKVTRQDHPQTEWVDMRKGVAWLFRYREVSTAANARYLDALAVVADPTHAKRDLHRLSTAKRDAAGRGCAGFNPLATPDAQLFQSLMTGEHCLRGFTNRDVRARLTSTAHLRSCGSDLKKQSAKYKGVSAIAGFDLLNEPVPPGGTYAIRQESWLMYAERLGTRIRSVDPNRVLIVESAPDATPPSFKNLRPISLKNIVYSVHSYLPMSLTHQGVMEPCRDTVTYDSLSSIEPNRIELYKFLANVAEVW
jgi:hypothetical protein